MKSIMKKNNLKKRGIGNRGVSLIMENLLYLIIIVVVIGVFLVGIGRVSGNSLIVEQGNSKKIALLIDKAKPGTTIELDISSLIEKAKNEKYSGTLIAIDNEKNVVSVHVTAGKGYSVNYFSDSEILWNINLDNEILYLEVKS